MSFRNSINLHISLRLHWTSIIQVVARATINYYSLNYCQECCSGKLINRFRNSLVLWNERNSSTAEPKVWVRVRTLKKKKKQTIKLSEETSISCISLKTRVFWVDHIWFHIFSGCVPPPLFGRGDTMANLMATFLTGYAVCNCIPEYI